MDAYVSQSKKTFETCFEQLQNGAKSAISVGWPEVNISDVIFSY